MSRESLRPSAESLSDCQAASAFGRGGAGTGETDAELALSACFSDWESLGARGAVMVGWVILGVWDGGKRVFVTARGVLVMSCRRFIRAEQLLGAAPT